MDHSVSDCVDHSAKVFDPLLILIVDCIVGDWNGDSFKMYQYFLAQVGLANIPAWAKSHFAAYQLRRAMAQRA